MTVPVGKSCFSRRTVRIAIRGAGALRRLEITVAGKRKATLTTAKALKAGVSLAGLPKGRYTVKLVGTTKAGKKLTLTKTYRTCAPKKAPTRRR